MHPDPIRSVPTPVSTGDRPAAVPGTPPATAQQDPGLDSMNLPDLKEFRKRAGELIRKKEAAHKTEGLERIKAIKQEYELSLREVQQYLKQGGAKVPAKYRDPDNPENTWSGRGKMSIWLEKKLAADPEAKKEDFLIEGQENGQKPS